MDLVVDRRAGGSEVLGGMHRWDFHCNWKFGADNFGGDNYHVPISHGSTGVTSPGQQRRPGVPNDGSRVNVQPGNGHCVIGGWIGAEQNMQLLSTAPEASQYFADQLPELAQRLGAVRGRQGSMGIATIFPNFTWFGFSGAMV